MFDEPTSKPSANAPGSTHICVLKGAPEIVIKRCAFWLDGKNEVHPIDDAFMTDFQTSYERFGLCGERVLGLAYQVYEAPKLVPGKKDHMELYEANPTLMPRDNLIFGGLVSLVDPPRDGVPEAVAKCRAASVRVCMVTGDHPLTAEAIARKIGIVRGRTRREVAHADGVGEEGVDENDPRVDAVVCVGYAM